MRALLDVNVLIALLDAAHVHHPLAMSWLEQQLSRGWASCPITQNGCVRIMSQPSYPGSLRAALVADRLAEAASSPDHVFWPDAVDLLEAGALEWSRILGHRQVTDAYLLALAVRNGGRLVCFDRRIAVAAVPNARDEHLVILA
jgi:hypothetical protein